MATYARGLTSQAVNLTHTTHWSECLMYYVANACSNRNLCNWREVTAAMIEGVVNSLRQVLHEDQAPVAITITDSIQFDTGFEAKEFAKIVGIELRPGDVVQE